MPTGDVKKPFNRDFETAAMPADRVSAIGYQQEKAIRSSKTETGVRHRCNTKQTSPLMSHPSSLPSFIYLTMLFFIAIL
jgi:hypothetical protein